ncbi:MAG: SusC/RagA family TonB-linked outer membrane protein [Gemmatimonadaceae bacterium]|nr:SusC/RagA family TonB-linked outer membrane protein [Gemmatimonadaceae bacterium]
MTSTVRVRWLLSAALALVAIFTGATVAAAQTTISGKVTNSQGAPVEGANVFIQALNAGTATSVNGTYSLTISDANARGQSVTLTARRIGFSPSNTAVSLTRGSQTQNFTLATDIRRLDEVVVTGVAQATSTKNLTISVGKVSEEMLKDVPAVSPATALAGKVAGVRVSFTQGQPGSSPALRVRGSTNLAVGGQNPLVLIDGVITKNGLADINGNDIEGIEVLKGAASANTYGSDAASGVISITTKRGRNQADNKLSFLTRNEFGTSEVEHYVPLNQHHANVLNADGSFLVTSANQRVIKADRYIDAEFPAGTYRNQLTENLRSGQYVTNYGQIALRRGNTNFSTSYSRDTDRGILPLLNGFRRNNIRLNLDQGLWQGADMSAALTYGLSNDDQTPNSKAGSGSTFFTLLQSPPDVDLTFPNGPTGTKYSPVLPEAAVGGTSRGNPLYDLANRSYNLRRERLIGSFSARYRPWEWLNIDGSYGTDRLNLRESNFYDRGKLTSNTSLETPGPGSLGLFTANNTASNTQGNVTTNFQFGQLRSTTRATYLYEDERNYNFGTSTSKLLVGSVPDLQSADPTQLSTSSIIQPIRTMNGFITQNFNYGDRYLMQLLGRRDGSSLFGAANRWNNFYGISGAWRISEDFTLPGIQDLKIRAARGTAGLRPGFDFQYETYNVTAGNLTKNTIGNKNLKPAIQTENEVGLNVSFLDRFDAEFVKSDRHTEGAFLLIPLSLAQSGGFRSQYQNAARVGARTFELTLNTRVFERPNFSYNFTLTGERSRQKIDQLNRAPFRAGSTSQGQNIFFYKAGEQLGVIYGQQFVRDLERLKDNPLNSAIDLNLYTVNDGGYVVLKSCINKACERPIVYVDAKGSNNVKIGDVNPDYSFGWSNTLRARGFTVYGLLDGTRGGQIYNFTKQWMFQDGRHAELDQAGKAPENKHVLDYYSVGFYNALEPNSHFVEDGSYVKLRELSLSYALSPSLVNSIRFLGEGRSVKVAMIGRNLKTWTNYSGFDPESSSNGDFNFRIDGFRYPSFRQISGQIEIGF